MDTTARQARLEFLSRKNQGRLMMPDLIQKLRTLKIDITEKEFVDLSESDAIRHNSVSCSNTVFKADYPYLRQIVPIEQGGQPIIKLLDCITSSFIHREVLLGLYSFQEYCGLIKSNLEAIIPKMEVLLKEVDVNGVYIYSLDAKSIVRLDSYEDQNEEDFFEYYELVVAGDWFN